MSWNSVQLDSSDQPKTAHFYKTYTLVGLKLFPFRFSKFESVWLNDWCRSRFDQSWKNCKTRQKKILFGAHRDEYTSLTSFYKKTNFEKNRYWGNTQICTIRGCQIGIQRPQFCEKPRHFWKLDMATSRMAFLDLNLHCLQLAPSNSNKRDRSVIQNCTSDTPYIPTILPGMQNAICHHE